MICHTRTHEAFVRKAQFYGLAVLICLAVWLLTGVGGSFWPMWVILGVVLRLGLAARQVYGRAAA